MSDPAFLTAILLALHFLIQVALGVRVMLRPHRAPASRLAWLMVIFTLPILGLIAYILFGEVNIGRRRAERRRLLRARMPAMPTAEGAVSEALRPHVPERHAHLFRVGQSITGLAPIGGNRGTLMVDSNATIDAMVADIDAACGTTRLRCWAPFCELGVFS